MLDWDPPEWPPTVAGQSTSPDGVARSTLFQHVLKIKIGWSPGTFERVNCQYKMKLGWNFFFFLGGGDRFSLIVFSILNFMNLCPLDFIFFHWKGGGGEWGSIIFFFFDCFNYVFNEMYFNILTTTLLLTACWSEYQLINKKINYFLLWK